MRGTIDTTRCVIPVGMFLATMAASVLVALQSSAVPALSARIHDELKPSTDSLICAVTGPLNNSAAFEDDTIKAMPRSLSDPHVEKNHPTTYHGLRQDESMPSPGSVHEECRSAP
jgi:hypothetical protein